MRKQFSRIISLILSAVIICTMAGVPSLAVGSGGSDVGLTSLNLVGESSTINKLDTEGWKWVPGISGEEVTGGTLTLKNVTINAEEDSAINLPGSANIELADGSLNTINVPDNITAIEARDLVIKGNGVLNILSSKEYGGSGINCDSLNIVDSTVSISYFDNGISSNDTLTIGEKAKVTLDNIYYGIYANNSFTAQKGSTVLLNVIYNGLQTNIADLGGNLSIDSNEGAISAPKCTSTSDSVISLKANKLFSYWSPEVAFGGTTTIQSGSIINVDKSFTNSGNLTNNGILLIGYVGEFKNTGTWNGNKIFYYKNDTAPEIAGFTAMKIRTSAINLTIETDDGNPTNAIDKLSEEGWKWDPANGGTLTLKNIYLETYKNAIILPAGAKLLTEEGSTNYIIRENASKMLFGKVSYMPSVIYSLGSITIGGSGTLNINNGSSYGIISEAGNIDITGGNLNIVTGDASIQAEAGNVTISGGNIEITSEYNCITTGGDFTITGGKLNVNSNYIQQDKFFSLSNENDEVFGIKIGGNFTLNGGKIDVDCTDIIGIDVGGNFIATDGELKVNSLNDGIDVGGEFTVTGGDLDVNSIYDAIDVTGNVLINGGKINITSDDTGFDIDGNIKITNGTVDIYSCQDSLQSMGSIEITGGNVTATSTDGGLAAILAGSDSEDSDFSSQIKISGGTVSANNRCSESGFGILVIGKGIEITGGTVMVETFTGYPAILAATQTVGASQLIKVIGMDTTPSNAVGKSSVLNDETPTIFATFTSGGDFTVDEGPEFAGDYLTKIKLTKHIDKPTPDPTPTPTTDSDSDSDDDTPSPAAQTSKTVTVVEAPASMQGGTSLVTVNASNNAFNQSVEVKLKDDAATKKAVEEAIKSSNAALPKDAKVLPLDISLYIKGTDTKVQPNAGETVEISVPVPTELLADKDSIVVVCVVDSKLQVLPTKIVEKDGKYFVVFTASHFSPYAFVVDKDKKLTTTTKGNPSTGVN